MGQIRKKRRTIALASNDIEEPEADGRASIEEPVAVRAPAAGLAMASTASITSNASKPGKSRRKLIGGDGASLSRTWIPRDLGRPSEARIASVRPQVEAPIAHLDSQNDQTMEIRPPESAQRAEKPPNDVFDAPKLPKPPIAAPSQKPPAPEKPKTKRTKKGEKPVDKQAAAVSASETPVPAVIEAPSQAPPPITNEPTPVPDQPAKSANIKATPSSPPKVTKATAPVNPPAPALAPLPAKPIIPAAARAQKPPANTPKSNRPPAAVTTNTKADKPSNQPFPPQNPDNRSAPSPQTSISPPLNSHKLACPPEARAAIIHFLSTSILPRVFTLLSNPLSESHICRIPISLFSDPIKLQIAERFLIRQIFAHLGGARLHGLLDKDLFPLVLDSIDLGKGLPDFALLTVTSNGDTRQLVVFKETGDVAPGFPASAFPKLAPNPTPLPRPGKKSPPWTSQQIEWAQRFLVASTPYEMMCPVVAGFLSNPRSTIADLLATSAGYNGSMDRLAEEFAYVREAKNGCFEVLPHALEEPLLVLQSTGEIVGQAGEVGAEFFRVVMGAKMEGWDGVVKEWMEKGLGSAEAVIGKMRDKAKAGVSFWVEQIEDEDL